MRLTTASRLSALWIGPNWAAATLITRMDRFLFFRRRLPRSKKKHLARPSDEISGQVKRAIKVLLRADVN
jgi:hypothetical protein